MNPLTATIGLLFSVWLLTAYHGTPAPLNAPRTSTHNEIDVRRWRHDGSQPPYSEIPRSRLQHTWPEVAALA